MDRPPWVSDDAELPDSVPYISSEQFVAGAISVLPPFDKYHPAWALPIARRALDALGEWRAEE